MPKEYFASLPKINYRRENNTVSFPGGQQAYFDLQATDLFVKFKIRESILNNAALFYPYNWRDTDRPDTLAHLYYGSSSFFWVVFYSVGAFDLNYDFPMPNGQFQQFLLAKYEEDTETAYGSGWSALTDVEKRAEINSYVNTTTHSYEIEDKYIVDVDTYNATPASDRRIITIFDYENELNESKRQVKLIDNDYLQNVVREYQEYTSAANAEREQLVNPRN